MNSALKSLVIFVLFLSLSSCGGGSSRRAPQEPEGPPLPPEAPFGLTQRAPLASFDLPVDGTSVGSYTLGIEYPSLPRFNGALLVAAVPDENRLVAVEQGGRVHVFNDDPGVDATAVVLDMSQRIVVGGEEGLLGFTFDPNFTQSRYVYMHYSMGDPRRSVISRMTWNRQTDVIETVSEKVILEVEQPFRNHNGGMVAFGPDGKLYIALGDGGSANDPGDNAQDRTNLLGSILRLNVHPADDNTPYEIPLDNPFVGEAGVRGEIYAYGLRNPFRFSFDQQTGDLWVGDVGQNAIEEIDRIEAGGNYGWRTFEGTQATGNDSQTAPPNATLIPPVYEYAHSVGRSVIGGYVYRGSRVPSLRGRYIYADYISNLVWALGWDGRQVIANDEIGQVSNPTGFGETATGEVLIVSQGNGGLWSISEDGGSGDQVPAMLSQTGLFDDVAGLVPASGLIEYAPAHPFWSDGVAKRRWVGIPDGSGVDFSTDNWTFPEGTIVVKHFYVELTEGDPATARRLETRVLINTTRGWQGFTYRWNNQGTDATLLSGAESEMLTITLAGGGTRDQQYDYPSGAQCMICHTEAAGFTLGLKTAQLNGDFSYQEAVDNQLRSWNNIGLFGVDIGSPDQYDAFAALDDASASLNERARAYLDVNCSQCHQPRGGAPTSLDFRATTTIGSMNAVGVTPSAGTLGIANAEIIAAGDAGRSVLVERMKRLDNQRMPPLATHVVDEEGLALIEEWINGL